jgi:hypothetical protein
MVIPAKQGDHLLVTVSDPRVTFAWALVSTEQGFLVGLETRVDEGVTVDRDMVKTSHRKYSESNGYTVVSEFYRWDEAAQRYAKMTP